MELGVLPCRPGLWFTPGITLCFFLQLKQFLLQFWPYPCRDMGLLTWAGSCGVPLGLHGFYR